MPLTRVLEPEVMDTYDEAHDYDAMDHVEVNARFCEDLLAFVPELAEGALRVLDVGTGTARIPIALCARTKIARIVGIDLAEHMLTVARENVLKAALGARIGLRCVDGKRAEFDAGEFDVVMSNTIVHHIPEPRAMLTEAVRLSRAAVFIRDLARPESDAQVAELSRMYGGEPRDGSAAAVASHARQRTLFEASLRAALTLSEVRALVAGLGVPAAAVTMTSDRHWTLAYAKGA